MIKVKHLPFKVSLIFASLLLMMVFILSARISSAQKELKILREELKNNADSRSEMAKAQLEFSRAREKSIQDALQKPTTEVTEVATTATTIPGKVIEVKETIQPEPVKTSTKKSRTS